MLKTPAQPTLKSSSSVNGMVLNLDVFARMDLNIHVLTAHSTLIVNSFLKKKKSLKPNGRKNQAFQLNSVLKEKKHLSNSMKKENVLQDLKNALTAVSEAEKDAHSTTLFKPTSLTPPPLTKNPATSSSSETRNSNSNLIQLMLQEDL